MRFSQPIHTGDFVSLRSLRWRIVDIRAYDECQLITVSGAGIANAGVRRRFLLPFEPIEPVTRAESIRPVTPRRWRRACRALLADLTPPGGLRSARTAKIDLLPHQLEPALAVVRGYAARLLLADDVGLGKTIQAGLVVAELQALGMADRILIVTPPGLRDQWVAELSDRFGIHADVIDHRDIRRRVSCFGIGSNPWATVRIGVASIDYVKRADVLPSVLACRWDVFVVDEAHTVTTGSDRHAAADALAGRAPYVLLLTATPHDGNRRGFTALCDLGAHGDPILLFKRSRAEVRLATRRHIHRLPVHLSPAEARMHVLLAEFTRAVRAESRLEDVWLPLSVFHKRALSSADSLQRSVGRRLAGLHTDGADEIRQLSLPLPDPGGELDEADEPPAWTGGFALNDTALEIRLLRRLLEAAEAATVRETKISAILRLARRISEPILIFTEYRDTLFRLCRLLDEPVAILHGGLTRQERRTAIDDFISARRRILVATDAAGGGLNLHHRCRVVVNLELPWNPMRLEQRIGRVDRIGQGRTVHVFHLIAHGTSEERILERLKSRIARAREDVSVADPLFDHERDAASAVFDEPDLPSGQRESTVAPAVRGSSADGGSPGRLVVGMGREAAMECDRLMRVRAVSHHLDDSARHALESGGAWLTTAHLSATRIRLGRRLLAILRVDIEDAEGRSVNWMLVPIAANLSTRSPLTAAEVGSLLRSIQGDLQQLVDASIAQQRYEIEQVAGALIATRVARERAIAQTIVAASRIEFQAGLFDTREEAEYLSQRAAARDRADDIERQIAHCERAATLAARPQRPLLILTP
jgi:superfamily II DNA or RNA helicase